VAESAGQKNKLIVVTHSILGQLKPTRLWSGEPTINFNSRGEQMQYPKVVQQDLDRADDIASQVSSNSLDYFSGDIYQDSYQEALINIVQEKHHEFYSSKGFASQNDYYVNMLNQAR